MYLRKTFFLYIDGFQVEKERVEDADVEIVTVIMRELESGESATERRNQQGKGIKILTPSQMLTGLPISLVQLKAGNNSEKL